MNSIAHISLDQYELMIEHGVFDGRNHQRVELIRGEIRQMNPIGREHATLVDYLTEWSFRDASRDKLVRIQNPILLPESDSVPEPDVAWVERKRYTRHPMASDVLLLIEVADATLAGDCGEKALLYAEARIAEYWVVDVAGRRLIMHRDPTGGEYARKQEFGEDEPATPQCNPAAQLLVKELFSML